MISVLAKMKRQGVKKKERSYGAQQIWFLYGPHEVLSDLIPQKKRINLQIKTGSLSGGHVSSEDIERIGVCSPEQYCKPPAPRGRGLPKGNVVLN